jgi:hypothetical protein
MKKPLRSWRTTSRTSTWPPRIVVSQNRGPSVSNNPCKNLPQPSNSSPTAPTPHYQIRREAGTAFADGVEDPAIKLQLLLGGGKTVNEALRQAVLLAARPHKTNATVFWESRSPPPPGRRDPRRSACCSCGQPGHFRGSCPYGGCQKTTTGAGNVTKGLRKTQRNRREGPNGDQEIIERKTGGTANRRERSGGRRIH